MRENEGAAEELQEEKAPAALPMATASPLRYFRDRLSYIAAFAIALVLAGAALVLGQIYYPSSVDIGTVLYAGALVLCCLSIWLTLDYMRQRSYFRQLDEAYVHAAELDAPLRVRSGVTGDQIAVQRLLQAQHEAYMNELGRYRRQQEMHQHFIHQWVHQMKTPIAVIDLMIQQADQAQGEDNGPASNQSLNSLREETERLTRGLDMMLYAARLEKFELDVHVRTVPLHEIARRAINSYKRLCIKYSIYPQITGEASVQTDEKWMFFIINQLVGNAIKYSKHQPGSKKLQLLIGTERGLTELQVKDEGMGIPEHDLPRVFDPFFTGDNGRRVEESTGMGLFLAKSVCGKLGHRIAVNSEPDGGGTTVTVTFEARSLFKLEGK
ncbi:sensor histidine kinase [Paenibacillus nasutitermitis]|uniref:histidine kinase n=1 Tax=Paenibacillus nasutitermitis TaxID=1652958 RepID=A0A917DWF4_9BACL|nr:sensor histidine kinase [Paenibacillus nasutitermitis]GGD75151.1 two-component sensor histidine kinase [Paenibacillus nasutitermitis]